ncbi:hypothetical protein Bbelb_013500 [Branchiostoma belcheri]|nr:hypothetical protein Bbelb_013500 [Branchiostoma belcheri]
MALKAILFDSVLNPGDNVTHFSEPARKLVSSAVASSGKDVEVRGKVKWYLLILPESYRHSRTMYSEDATLGLSRGAGDAAWKPNDRVNEGPTVNSREKTAGFSRHARVKTDLTQVLARILNLADIRLQVADLTKTKRAPPVTPTGSDRTIPSELLTETGGEPLNQSPLNVHLEEKHAVH